jgi:competence protein ComGC
MMMMMMNVMMMIVMVMITMLILMQDYPNIATTLHSHAHGRAQAAHEVEGQMEGTSMTEREC